MARPVVWFVAGVLAAVLVLGGVVVGSTYFAGDADALGIWQVKTGKDAMGHGGLQINGQQEPVNPEHFYDDWVVTLPSNCDLGTMYQVGFDAATAYRCP